MSQHIHIPLKVEGCQITELSPHKTIFGTGRLAGNLLSCLSITGNQHSAGMAYSGNDITSNIL